jgi:hypothetical protein
LRKRFGNQQIDVCPDGKMDACQSQGLIKIYSFENFHDNKPDFETVRNKNHKKHKLNKKFYGKSKNKKIDNKIDF